MKFIVSLMLAALAHANASKRVPLIRKDDKLRTAKVFVKMDKEYEKTLHETFQGTQLNNVEAHFKRVFDSVNEVYIAQFQLQFSVQYEGALDSEKEKYPFFFDEADEKQLGLCEKDAEFENFDDVKKLFKERLNKFTEWANQHRSNEFSMVLLFTGCSYTFEKADDTQPLGFELPLSVAKVVGTANTSSQSNRGLAYLNQFCKSTGNTGAISLQRKTFKSTEKFVVTVLHEAGHLLGADHVGLEDRANSLGIMDYDGGYYDGKIQFFNDAQTIKNMTAVFDASLMAGEGREERCWSTSEECPSKCVRGLGDGECSSDEDCRGKNCAYDGYDCNDDGTPLCAMGCRKSMIGDGVCDAQCLPDSCAADAKSEGEGDCRCSSTSAIAECISSGRGDKAECVLLCGKHIVSDLVSNAKKIIGEWKKQLPGPLAEQAAWLIPTIAVAALLILVAVCYACCSPKKKNNRGGHRSKNQKGRIGGVDV